MKIKIKSASSELGKLVIIPFFEKNSGIELPIDAFETTVSKNVFSGKKDTQFILERSDIIYILLGVGSEPTYHSIATAFRRITAKHADLIEDEIDLYFTADFSAAQQEAALNGLFLGTYRLGHFKKSEKPARDWDSIQLGILSNEKNIEELAKDIIKISEAQLECMKLVDLPPNTATPFYLSNWTKEASEKYHFGLDILDREAAKKIGLKAFLAVSQGSETDRAPQFIIAEYRVENPKKHLGLVGKGVTFDTGGLNIKTAGMVHMKCDMGGAATVLGALQAIADLQLPYDVTAIVPCVENAVDSLSFLPSDVIGSYSGKTIEIIDTDAEGRLILADGLSYLVKNYKTDHVLDFATLTGSAVGTFGYDCAALFTNDKVLSEKLQNAGDQISERMWPLPLWDSYKSEMDSEIADIKNYNGKPLAGAITAAKFLEAFTENHPSWAHIDIAGTAFGDSEFAKTKHATAYGVHLIVKLLQNL